LILFYKAPSLKASLLLAGILLAVSGWAEPGRADCHSDYNQAVTLLDSTTEKAAGNSHPNPEAFAGDFKKLVDKMQGQKCLPELMSLIQHIQSEQQKYPSPDPARDHQPVPVVD